MASKQIVQKLTSKEEFDNMLETEKRLLVVDVYSEWCGPCVQMTPTFQTLTVSIEAFTSRVHLVCIERKLHPDLAEKYPESSKPQFLFYDKGKCVNEIDRVDAPAILRTIEEYIPQEWTDE